MTDDAPSNGPATPDAPATEPPAAPAGAATAEVHPGGSLTNADIAALSRERLETLLSILPPAVAAILITNRPPMPPHVEYEAHRKLVGALARARARIPSVPMDKTVDYVSKRTGEHVHYSFASLDAIHKTVTGPLSEQGLVIECASSTATSSSCSSATTAAGSTCPGCRCPTRATSRTWRRRSPCGGAT